MYEKRWGGKKASSYEYEQSGQLMNGLTDRMNREKLQL